MRIRIRQRPPVASIDGLRLDRFEPGFLYDVGTTLGILLLAEGWAEPVLDEQPALLVPLSETASPGLQPQAQSSANAAVPPDAPAPRNWIREFSPPYADRLGIAADFERRKRRR
jgi:hypothetical protein